MGQIRGVFSFWGTLAWVTSPSWPPQNRRLDPLVWFCGIKRKKSRLWRQNYIFTNSLGILTRISFRRSQGSGSGPLQTQSGPLKSQSGPYKARAGPFKARAGPCKARAVPLKPERAPPKPEQPLQGKSGPSKARAYPSKARAGPSKGRAGPSKSQSGPLQIFRRGQLTPLTPLVAPL